MKKTSKMNDSVSRSNEYTSGSAAPGGIFVQHLATVGFLLIGGGRKFLIDGIYGEPPRGMSALSPETRKKLLDGEPPFDGVTHVLVSHYHKDHFDPAMVRDFLRNQDPELWLPDDPRAVLPESLFSSRSAQADPSGAARSVQPVRSDAARSARPDPSSLHLVPLDLEDRCDVDLGSGDVLSYFVMPHSGRQFRGTEVVCFALKIAGFSFLFLSDADFDPVRIGALAGGTAYDAVFANALFLDVAGGREALFSALDAGELCICHLPLPEDDANGVRDLADRCIEAYGLPRERITVLKDRDEVLTFRMPRAR